jgi:hypothetical protein
MGVFPRPNTCTIWWLGSLSIGMSLGYWSDMKSTDLKHLPMMHGWFPLFSPRHSKRLGPRERRGSAPQSDAVAAKPLGACRCRAPASGGETAPKRKQRPGPATGRQHTAHSVQGSRVLQRIVDGEAFGLRRHQ